MHDQMNLFEKLKGYTKERLPVVPSMINAGAMFFVAYSFTALLGAAHSFSITEIFLGILFLFFIMFHLRIFDEHKDYSKDIIAHPDRMLSKGEITLSDLKKVFVAIVGIEILISIYFGPTQVIVWMIIFTWSALMAVEFFVPDFLNDHQAIYLISHQILVPLMMAFPISMRYNFGTMDITDFINLTLFFTACICGTITFEIARKTWSPDREHEHADSYTKFWGKKTAVMVNQLVAITATLLFLYLYAVVGKSSVYMYVLVFSYLVFAVAEMRFYFNSTHKNSKIVEIIGALFVLATFVNSAICFSN